MDFKNTVIKSAVTRMLMDHGLAPSFIIVTGQTVVVTEGHYDIIANTIGESKFTIDWTRGDQFVSITFDLRTDHELAISNGKGAAISKRAVNVEYQSNFITDGWIEEMLEEVMTRLGSI